MDKSPDDAGFDPGTYGRSFAEVYDSWYPSSSATDVAVARISELVGPRGRILELGVGTGRLALPLAELGHQVVGLDSSPEMLELLNAKIPESLSNRLLGVLADVGTPEEWPGDEFDAVVAAFNLVFNLADEEAQRNLFHAAGSHMGENGSLVVEAFVPAPREPSAGTERHLELRSVTAESVTLIATEMDPGTGIVVGQHIELVDGRLPRLRPWRIKVASPEDLDAWAAEAGLRLTERHADWAGAVYSESATNHVSVYRR